MFLFRGCLKKLIFLAIIGALIYFFVIKPALEHPTTTQILKVLHTFVKL